jgi:hypothetical protein
VIAWAESELFHLFIYRIVTHNNAAPTPINTITFTDDYFIAACKHGIEDGCEFLLPTLDFSKGSQRS